METKNWTSAPRALAAAYRPSRESIRIAVAKLRDEPQELVAELASVLAECIETKTLPDCVHLGDAMNAAKAIWPEVLASLAMNREPRVRSLRLAEPMQQQKQQRVQLRVQLRRR